MGSPMENVIQSWTEQASSWNIISQQEDQNCSSISFFQWNNFHKRLELILDSKLSFSKHVSRSSEVSFVVFTTLNHIY